MKKETQDVAGLMLELIDWKEKGQRDSRRKERGKMRQHTDVSLE